MNGGYRRFEVTGASRTCFQAYVGQAPRDGERFFVYYRDEAGRGNIEVYSSVGEKLAHGQAPGEIEKIDSSIDGSLVAGYVFLKDRVTEKIIKHIIVLNSFDARTKMIKAEESTIPGWRARFLLSSLVSPKPEPGKIMLIVAETGTGGPNKPRKWHGKLTFEEIPEDLSSLLKISAK